MAWMQEPVARSKTQKIIVHAVTSRVKVQRPKMQNKKYREIGLSKWNWDIILYECILISQRFFVTFVKQCKQSDN